MSNFVFAQNIESINAAKAAQSSTHKARRPMNEVAAIGRIYDLVRANDGVSRAVIISPTADMKDVWVSINQALDYSERNNIARAIRPAITALGGKQVHRFANGKRKVYQTWRIDAETYKAATAAYKFNAIDVTMAI